MQNSDWKIQRWWFYINFIWIFSNLRANILIRKKLIQTSKLLTSINLNQDAGDWKTNSFICLESRGKNTSPQKKKKKSYLFKIKFSFFPFYNQNKKKKLKFYTLILSNAKVILADGIDFSIFKEFLIIL